MKRIFLGLVVFIGVSSVLPVPISRKPIKDASSCQVCQPVDSTKINVHLVPHSHDDVGWLKTVDQYYFGSHSDIQSAGVQYIISSTVEALKEDPSRRFIQVETAFFWKWWNHQSKETQQDFIDLVNNGQIEMINGGWSMNDEATVNYQSTIDQFTYGLKFLNETLGSCGVPKIGWQIDPFGHSREQASIYAQMDYDAVFFARLDHNDKNSRIENKNMEVIWKGSANLENKNVFTSIFPEFYSAPGGFCFDINCGDEVINNDINSPDYNLPRRAADFVEIAKKYASYYKTNNVLVPMGGDFEYQSAHKNYMNMDRLIKGLEDNEEVNVFYSTPSCYVKAVHESAEANGVSFNEKSDDFFPYSSDDNSFWAGYFTSRPNCKRFERQSNNILQAAKQLAAFSRINGQNRDEDLRKLNQAVGVLQHHDAITGTAKREVAKDYARLLTAGVKSTESLMGETLINLLKKDSSTDFKINLETCLMTNMSICEPSKADKFVVTVYNPLEREVTQVVRIPVPDGGEDQGYKITGPDGEELYDLLYSISSFSYVQDIPETPNPKELVFAARNLPGFGVKLYHVEKIQLPPPKKQTKQPRFVFGNDDVGFTIDDSSGRLTSITMNGITVQVSQDFYYYKGHNGIFDSRASGAYIFRPMEQESIQVTDQPIRKSAMVGELVDEVQQEFADNVVQIIRVYKVGDQPHIELDWLIGPIEVDEPNGIGREYISRFKVSDFDNQNTFYTDSNGREMLQRVVNERPEYEYDSNVEPVASNYYPVTSKISIKDESKNIQVSVLTDRSQGGSSLRQGEIELMLHRRLIRDDNFGVGEWLNDDEFGQGVVARGQLYLTLSAIQESANERELAMLKLLQPVVMVARATEEALSLENIQQALNFKFEGIKTALPENVHVLSFEPWQDDSYLLRLEHILENNEDVTLSQEVTVDLNGLFALFEISELKETTLGANVWLEDTLQRQNYVWNTKDGEQVSNKMQVEPLVDGQVTLQPMQIRTFVVKIAKNSI